MIRQFVKTTTGEGAEAVQLSEATVSEVIRWVAGFQVEEIDPETNAKFVAVLYETPMGRKRVSEGNWLVYFKSEFFEATPEHFNEHFTLKVF